MANPPQWLIRIAGIAGLTVLALVLFFNTVGKIDVAWALPWTKPFRAYWPDLPIFASWHTQTDDGRQETIYQVPSHQLTREEIAHLRYNPDAAKTAPGLPPSPAATNAAPATSPPAR